MILIVSLTAIVCASPHSATAQEATPTVVPSLTETCATLLGEPTSSEPPITGGVAASTFDEVPFDLLAIDTLTAHDEAVVALLTVAGSGGQQRELRQLVASSRSDYRTEITTLTDVRGVRFPDAPQVPIEYQTAVLDQALAAAGIPAGSGEAPVIDPIRAAEFLCTAGDPVPFDLAVIDLLSAELQSGVAIALLTTQRTENPELLAQGQAVVERETTMIGRLATWRDAWFGPGAPMVVAPIDGGHDDATPPA